MSVNAAPSSKGVSFGMRVTDCGMASATWAYPPRVSVVLSTSAITCSPALNPLPAGALTTSPEISAPGTNGRGGLDWYWPATMSASKKLMPVALMLIRTSPSAGSPASTSSKCIESGPPTSCTTQAFTGRRLHQAWGRAGRVGPLPPQPAGTERGMASGPSSPTCPAVPLVALVHLCQPPGHAGLYDDEPGGRRARPGSLMTIPPTAML